MSSYDGTKVPQEEAYFEKANAEALQRIREQRGDDNIRKSPITGEPMEQITIFGVAVDRCPTSGGIWLDKGEMEELAKAYSKEWEAKENPYTVQNFIATIFGYEPGTTE